MVYSLPSLVVIHSLAGRGLRENCLAMSREIERKYLVTDSQWPRHSKALECRQGYLVHGPPVSVRVRSLGDKGYVTIKRQKAELPKKSGSAVEREEIEFSVASSELEGLFAQCTGHIIDKTRYYVEFEGYTWEVDVFRGPNEGLVVAEIELSRVDENVPLPPWVGEEVSHDPRYFNTSLSLNPYSTFRNEP